MYLKVLYKNRCSCSLSTNNPIALSVAVIHMYSKTKSYPGLFFKQVQTTALQMIKGITCKRHTYTDRSMNKPSETESTAATGVWSSLINVKEQGLEIREPRWKGPRGKTVGMESHQHETNKEVASPWPHKKL